jgi:hypothetical protein
MKPGTPCLHCRESGCGIYERRPVDPCRNFVCGWLEEGSPLPEHFKPSECGVIVQFNHPWNGMKVTLAVPAGKKIPPEMLEYLTAQARKASIPLIFLENVVKNGKITDQKGRGFGPPSFINAVKNHLQLDDLLRL